VVEAHLIKFADLESDDILDDPIAAFRPIPVTILSACDAAGVASNTRFEHLDSGKSYGMLQFHEECL
jgi:hypothetical protein